MEHLKTYKLFEAQTGLTAEQEEFLNGCTNGTWSYNLATGLVDVEGDFVCARMELKNFKGIKFGKVSGSCDCSRNKLTSLEGSPQKVGGYFLCDKNKLTSLAGAPQEVGKGFYCGNNKLTSLEGAPQKVGGDFWCGDNKLTSLKGAPQEVGGDFDCYENKLTSLAGAPQKGGGGFYCDAFRLERREWNLKGWLKALAEGSEEARMLISTILTPEFLNGEITKNPSGMVMTLKSVWNDPSFKDMRDQLKIPDRLKPEMKLLGDLDSLGF